MLPFTLKYLDLSTLNLKNKSARFPLPLFLREEYDHISRLINSGSKSGIGSAIVSGQPGTGKTAYLYSRIIESLVDGVPFLYQTKEGNVCRIGENGVEVNPSSLSPEAHIMAFVDGDRGDGEPDSILLNSFVQIIVALPPDSAYQPWTKQTGDDTKFDKLATSLWSPRELFLTGMFLHPIDITFKLLRKSTSYFGYNPRLCFDASSSEVRLERATDEFLAQIRTIGRNPKRVTLALESIRTGADTVSHTIFQLNPADDLRYLGACDCETVSRWAFDSLLRICETEEADSVAKFARQLKGMSWAASFLGGLFERQVLTYLDDIKATRILPIRGLTNPGQKTWTYRVRKPRITFKESKVIEEITVAVNANKPVHLVPSAANFLAVDSIVYDPQEVLTCIKVMMNREHPIAVSGLRRIQSWFLPNTPLADLRPKKTKPWRIVFIVPDEMASTFRKQMFEDDTLKGEWDGKVDQYVLGVGSLKHVLSSSV